MYKGIGLPHNNICYIAYVSSGIIYVFKIRFKNEHRGHIVYILPIYLFGLIFFFLCVWLQFQHNIAYVFYFIILCHIRVARAVPVMYRYNNIYLYYFVYTSRSKYAVCGS